MFCLVLISDVIDILSCLLSTSATLHFIVFLLINDKDRYIVATNNHRNIKYVSEIVAVPDAAPEICASCFELSNVNSNHRVTLYMKVCIVCCFLKHIWLCHWSYLLHFYQTS